MPVRRTQDRYRDAAGRVWKWTVRGWRPVAPKNKKARWGLQSQPHIALMGRAQGYGMENFTVSLAPAY